MNEGNVIVRMRRLSDDVVLPTFAHAGDAGMDLRSIETVTLQPMERRLVATGLAVAIPDGYAGLVLPRSGLALKEGLTVANTPGLIDAHYRGELKVIAINVDPKNPVTIEAGDRIAQLVIQRIPEVQIVEVDELDDTDRGEGGFGSSGIR